MERYYSLNRYLRETFGEKVYKLALDGGMTCPNRDGTLDTRGCIFCSEGGSGEFAEGCCGNIHQQIAQAKQRVRTKSTASKFIAYFQSFTNTYADISYLRQLFMAAISEPDIVALSIGTRPDCLGDDVISLLSELNQIKPIWVELGLQTIHPKTASYIRRGYELPVFEDALFRLHRHQIYVIVHVILGLPRETREDMLATVRYLSHEHRPDGIKLQLLHVLKGTDLANDYANGLFQAMQQEDYFQILFDCIEELPEDMVIHRLTGDGPKSLLMEPMWSANKKMVLNEMSRQMEQRDVVQGKKWKSIHLN